MALQNAAQGLEFDASPQEAIYGDFPVGLKECALAPSILATTSWSRNEKFRALSLEASLSLPVTISKKSGLGPFVARRGYDDRMGSFMGAQIEITFGRDGHTGWISA